MRKNNGITLIALVITIIVLLILAAVSISAITGENGIVQKAKEAKDATRVAQIEEKIKLYQSENSLLAAGNETTKTIEEFIDELEKEGMITSKEKTEILENHTLTVGEQEPIVFPFAKTLVQAFKDGEIQIGDYVDYVPSDLDKSIAIADEYTGSFYKEQSYSVDLDTTWRVLGLNEDEAELLIISGSPLKKTEGVPYLDLVGVEGYYNSINILNNISKIYHNEELASETRSITIEDINNALGIVVENNVVYKRNDEAKTDLNIFILLGDTYTYKEGDYPLENCLKEIPGLYTDLESKTIGDTFSINTYGYSYLDENIVDKESDIYKLLFLDTLEADQCVKSYWLANQGRAMTSLNGKEMTGHFGVGVVYGGNVKNFTSLFKTNGYGTSFSSGVRPIVSLKSTVTIEDVPLCDGSEEVWERSEYVGEEDGDYFYTGPSQLVAN